STVRGVCIVVILIAIVSCRAASPDWNGTWKLDPAKSDIPGPTIVVSISPDGMWHNSGGYIANFRCDGKGYQAMDILTVYCTQANNSDVEITAFKNGSKLIALHWGLSSDGKTLSIKSTSFHDDGSAKVKDSRYLRTSGSVGFAGGWRNVNPLEAIPSIRQISLQGHTLHQSIPEKGAYIDVTLDGTDAVIHGPLGSGGSIALKERSPREFSATMKVHGEIVSVGYWQISADGHSLTDSYWVPGGPNKKAVLVYEKQ
ncbi:MAG: hypothetical protein WA722_10860, partial [Candidatus Sulfotelmatobacter sp.]